MTAEKNSYDCYLHYFKDTFGFLETLNEYNEEALEAVEQLIKGKRLLRSKDEEIIYQRVWSHLKNEIVSERLDRIFEALLSQNRFERVKCWIDFKFQQTLSEGCLQACLRTLAICTKKLGSFPGNRSFLLQVSMSLPERVYLGTTCYSNIL